VAKSKALIPSQQSESVWLHRFAVFVAAATVVLISVGAVVTSTKSGDAIPDWPTSYGSLIPSYLAGGVLFEWLHRMIAGVSALLVLILAVWLAVSDTSPYLKSMGVIAVVAVIAQGVLGGLRVLVVSHQQVQTTFLALTNASNAEVIRIAFAVAHATLAQIVLVLTFAIAFLTKPQRTSDYLPLSTSRLKFLSAVMLSLSVLLFVQLLLGAIMRHSEAGLIIPDFPTSFGRLIPPFGNLPFDPDNPQRMSYNEFAFKVAINFAHRLNGLVIGSVILWIFFSLRRQGLNFSPMRRLVAWKLGLVIAQIILGALTVWTRLSVPVTVAHVTVGATLLGLSVVAFCQSFPATTKQAIYA